MKRAAVVGAAGYAGVEAVRILLSHPEFELTCITSSGNEGESIASLYPALTDICDLSFEAHDAERIAAQADVAFLAVPHTASLAMTPALVAAGVQVIDLVGGLSSGRSEGIRGVVRRQAHERRFAGAGGLWPARGRSRRAQGRHARRRLSGLLPHGFRSGGSAHHGSRLQRRGPRYHRGAFRRVGAGRKATPKTHFCNADESVGLYGLPHRHTPEIAQTLSRAAGADVEVIFTPHLVPMVRGLLSTVYIPLDAPHTIEELHAVYTARYASEPFVSVCPIGTMPQTSWVEGSNRAQVGLASRVGWQAARRELRYRQSRQGRGRPGHPGCESRVRFRGNRRSYL